ncbi:MAG: PEP-CTERM sorting domain-containing protein, partial [bacterium]
GFLKQFVISFMISDNVDTDPISLNSSIIWDESGDNQLRDGSSVVWTGTDSSGSPKVIAATQPVDGTLGSHNGEQFGQEEEDQIAEVGDMARTDGAWLDLFGTARFNSPKVAEGYTSEAVALQRSIYVMSGEVTVVPEPSTVLLWLGCTGLAGLIYWRKRRRS